MRALTTRFVPPFLTTCVVNVTTCVSLALWRHSGGSGTATYVDCLLVPTAICFAPLRHPVFHYTCPFVPTTAMATGPSSVDATLGVTTPDRASTPLAVETTDSSDQGSLPAPAYNKNDYRFNHTGATLYYQPQQSLSNYTSQNARLQPYTSTTAPATYNSSQHLLLKSINYFHYNKQHHSTALTTVDQSNASQAT